MRHPLYYVKVVPFVPLFVPFWLILKPLKNKAFSLSGTNGTSGTILLRKGQIRAYSTWHIRYIGVFKCFWENAVPVVPLVPHERLRRHRMAWNGTLRGAILAA